MEIHHIECDLSYTMITVPIQPVIVGKQGNFNNGVFQFVVNEDEIVILRTKPGVSFCYSVFLLTRRQ